jgi:FlaA1/EpsC-like NDP-sugar epimerase
LLPSKLKRLAFFLLFDALIIWFSYWFSFYIRFGFIFPDKYDPYFYHWAVGYLVFNLLVLWLFGLYKITWRFVGLTELSNLMKAAALSTVSLYSLNLFLREFLDNKYDLPRGIILITAIMIFSLLAVLRISKRVYLEVFKQSKVGKRVLIIGADFTGKRLAKEMVFHKEDAFVPVAIVDEDPIKIGTYIEGIRIYGGHDSIPEVIREFAVESVLINLPRASHKKIAQLFEVIKKAGVSEIKVVPKVENYQSTVHRHVDFKELDIEDLLARRSVEIEYQRVEEYLRERTVLVTGASGSIGSEIMRRLIRFGVRRIVAFEIDESELFNLERELRGLKSEHQEIEFVVGDIREQRKVDMVFERFRPGVVFHAAAYKHVPLMESFPEEAVKTNIFGTRNLMETARKHGVFKFVNISTDKAVNPSSVMGASKRMCEMLGKHYDPGEFKVISVRFGNVLGSRGSVIPIFLEQIRNGGPITVTHPDMKRYFMSISEAVLLVMQAAYMGDGGEVFVLDMGEPVKIVTLAETLIRLNNLEPGEDIEIVYSGLRPGEKLFEELLTAEEGTDVTRHEKIYVAKNGSRGDGGKIAAILAQLREAMDKPELLVEILKEHVPFFKHSHQN